MIKNWIEQYQPKTQQGYAQALREIMQQIALAGLYRAAFFEKAAFYGGTALRIFYGLNRFSEDLDFSLLAKNENFELDNYLAAIKTEFDALGIDVSIKAKKKSTHSAIESAFLKSLTLWRELEIESIVPQIGVQKPIGLKIKIEVDTQPPLGFQTEEKLLLQPFSFYVKCFTIEDLFAGKMHALLFRKWKNNVKGRDWYDMEWYIRKGAKLNLNHLKTRAIESGDWHKNDLTEVEFRELLHERIETVDLNMARRDISRFIQDPKALEIWSKPYFHDVVKLLKIAN